MDDLSDVVDAFATGTYQVTRYSPSSYGTDGRLQPSAVSTFYVDASVQPATGRDLQRLPEGTRTTETLAVFSSTELKVQSPAQAPDVITVGAFSYEVKSAEQWGDVGAYWKCLAQKLGH